MSVVSERMRAMAFRHNLRPEIQMIIAPRLLTDTTSTRSPKFGLQRCVLNQFWRNVLQQHRQLLLIRLHLRRRRRRRIRRLRAINVRRNVDLNPHRTMRLANARVILIRFSVINVATSVTMRTTVGLDSDATCYWYSDTVYTQHPIKICLIHSTIKADHIHI